MIPLTLESVMEQLKIISQQQKDMDKRLDSIESDVMKIDDTVYNSCDECGCTLEEGRCYRCDEE